MPDVSRPLNKALRPGMTFPALKGSTLKAAGKLVFTAFGYKDKHSGALHSEIDLLAEVSPDQRTRPEVFNLLITPSGIAKKEHKKKEKSKHVENTDG